MVEKNGWKESNPRAFGPLVASELAIKSSSGMNDILHQLMVGLSQSLSIPTGSPFGVPACPLKHSLKDTFCNHLNHGFFNTKTKGHQHLQVAMFRCHVRIPDSFHLRTFFFVPLVAWLRESILDICSHFSPAKQSHLQALGAEAGQCQKCFSDRHGLGFTRWVAFSFFFFF